MASIAQLAVNLRHLRLAADLTQEQVADLAGMALKFYQAIETGRKPQLKLQTIERLAAPYSLDAWHLLAPLGVLKKSRFRAPKPLRPAQKGPRAKWGPGRRS